MLCIPYCHSNGLRLQPLLIIHLHRGFPGKGSNAACTISSIPYASVAKSEFLIIMRGKNSYFQLCISPGCLDSGMSLLLTLGSLEQGMHFMCMRHSTKLKYKNRKSFCLPMSYFWFGTCKIFNGNTTVWDRK